MPEDMYSDAGGEPAAAPEKAKDDGAATALLPKSFFPDPPEVGKTSISICEFSGSSRT